MGGFDDNSLEGCQEACSEFTGVEIDVHYSNGAFYMDHDSADPNADRLIQFTEWYTQWHTQTNQTCGLWVDLKTSDIQSVERLANITKPFDRLLVEVYDKKMIPKLNNLTLTSRYLDTDVRSIMMIEYILFSTTSNYFATWYADSFCLLDTFFYSGGSLALTDEPNVPPPCDNYLTIETWRVLAWVVIVFAVILVTCCLSRCCKKPASAPQKGT